MQHPLINLSDDLKRLVDDGYEVEIWSGFLILKNIPYVTSITDPLHAELSSQVWKGTLQVMVAAVEPGDQVA